jgi:HD-GYP domain-containing protein (c-di-GMP phosphodiesterase class II)
MARFSELIKNIDKKSEIYRDVAFGASEADAAAEASRSVPQPESLSVAHPVAQPDVPAKAEVAHPVKPKPNAFLLTNILKKQNTPVVSQAMPHEEATKPKAVHTNVTFDESFDDVRDVVTAIFERGADFLQGLSYDELSQIALKIDAAVSRREFLTKAYAVMIEESADYLVRHSCVCGVYAAVVAQAFGLSERERIETILAALLHDVAMRDHRDLVFLDRPLTAQERARMQTHVARAESYLSLVDGMPQDVVKAVSQHHERVDGSGYPEKIDKRKVLPAARIIAFIDAFVALCGHRAYRKRHTSIAAYKDLLAIKNSFSRKVVKICIDHVGLYPIGSEVELNTGEHAVVVAVNRLNALRPRLMLRSTNPDVVIGKDFDLMKHMTVYIKSAL